MTKIAVLIGSLREASVNKKLAKTLESLAPNGTVFSYADLNLPLYNQELEADFPSSVQNLKDLIETADGVLIISPEYNRSFSGVLKNAIDWASRPWGNNSFKGKPAGIIGVSPGQTGTAQAQAHLRNVMQSLDTNLLTHPELYISTGRVFDDNGQVIESYIPHLRAYIDALVSHSTKNKTI